MGSDNTPILVAHGALGSAAQMQPVADALHTAFGDTVTVDTLEFPGHGATPIENADHFRLTHFVDVMARQVSRYERPPMLFGYSMGGYVGLALESRAPGTFAGIATLGTKFEWTAEGAEREAARLDPAVIATKIPKFAEVLASRHAGAGGWEAVVQRTGVLLRENGRAPLLALDVLERVSIPVSVAVGSKDDTVSIQESQTAASVMLRAQCVVLDDIPHPIDRVPPAVVVQLVRDLVSAR